MTTTSHRAEDRPTFLHREATIAWRVLLVAAAGLLVIWLMLQVTVIAVAAFIGFAQAALLWPVVQRLSAHVPRVLAVLLVVLVYAAAIVALAWVVVRQLVSAAPALFDAMVGAVSATNDWLVEQGWVIPDSVAGNLESELTDRFGQLASGIGGAAVSTLSAFGSASTIIVVGLFATVFALVGGEKMTQAVVRMVPARRQLSTFAALRDASTTARWWVIASAVTGAVDGILIGGGMALLGVPLALPIGLATFILAFIPMIGATLAGVLAVAVALFFGGVSTAVWTLVIVLVVQQVEGNVLSPILLSRAMEFPPLLTLLLSTGGGIALGLVGLFLAVPVTGILVSAGRGWRRELPEEERAARGIGRQPRPDFDELSARARSRDQDAEDAEDAEDADDAKDADDADRPEDRQHAAAGTDRHQDEVAQGDRPPAT